MPLCRAHIFCHSLLLMLYTVGGENQSKSQHKVAEKKGVSLMRGMLAENVINIHIEKM